MGACSQPRPVHHQSQLHHVLPAPQNRRGLGSSRPIQRLLWLEALQACPHQSQPSAKLPVLTFLSKLVLVAYIAAKLQAGAGRSGTESQARPSLPWLHAHLSPQAPAQGVLAFFPRRATTDPQTSLQTHLLHQRHPGLRLPEPGSGPRRDSGVALPCLREDEVLCTRDRAGDPRSCCVL